MNALRTLASNAAQHWRELVSRATLPMLALAASYGVYSFAALFVPPFVAVIQAGAFELTYIGLALVQGMDEAARKRASLISVGAVVVSIIYNSLAGLFHTNPELLTGLSWWWWVPLAILHGAPLAWVAYLVSDLLLHSGDSLVTQLRAAQQMVADLSQQLAEKAQELADAAQRIAGLEQAQRERSQAAAESAAYAEQMITEHQRRAVEAERQAAELRRERDEAQRIVAEQAQALKRHDGIDKQAIAIALRSGRIASWSEASELTGVPQSTLRSWLKTAEKVQSNGHLIAEEA